MVEAEVEVINQLGLHARAAAKLVHLAATFQSRCTLEFEDGEQIDAKSILGILGRGAAVGSRLTVRCDGEDERAGLAALTALFADRFGEGR